MLMFTSDQLGLQPILEQLARFIKKSMQFDQSDIASDITALTLSVDGPSEVLFRWNFSKDKNKFHFHLRFLFSVK